MVSLIAVVLSSLGFGLAMLAFVAWARPEYLVGLLARGLGRGEAWRGGVLDPAEEELMEQVVRRMQIPLLFVVFSWSFLVGAVVCWLRL